MTRKAPYLPLLCTLALAALSASPLYAVTNNVALTPPMGWNDWNKYGCSITEYIVTNNAGIMATNGMGAAGYQFVDIDDGWAGSRDSNGVIQAYSIAGKFPDGIPWLSSYVHGLGLKLGLYTDDGTNTCSKCIDTGTSPTGKDPGSFQYEYVDAFTYALWGADYLKDDNCNAGGLDGQSCYGRMSDGLMKSGRRIVFCLCGGENGNSKSYQSWSPTLGNYWRTTGDIGSSFSSMISHIDPNSTSAFVAGPGRWNDPDMLEIGNGEFATNYAGAQSHFSMWCIMASPLIAGTDLGSLSAQSMAILTNSEAIAVDQDPAGEQGTLVGGTKDTAEVWSKPLGYDFTTHAVALFNRSTTATNSITVYWTNLAFQASTTATVRDLWAHSNLGTFANSFTTNVPPYSTVLLKVVGTPVSAPAQGTNYLSDMPWIYGYTGYGTIVANKSIGGNTITLAGTNFAKGIGVNSRSGVEYNLGGVCTRFQTTIGIDDEVGANGSVIFEVFADGVQIYNSGPLTGSSPSQFVNLDVTGVRRLTLGVDDDNDGTSNDHADWANALVIATNTPQKPEVPTGLTASPGNAIVLNWNHTLGGITYNVKRAGSTGGPYTTLTNTPITTFTDSNVVVGTPYYYVVSAVSSLGEGSNSTEVAVTPCNVPLVPANVVTYSSNSAVEVSWNASAGATSYSISRFTSATAPVVIATGVTATNYLDTSATLGQIYFYWISASNACNQSAPAPFVAGQSSLPSVPVTPPVYWTNTITSTPQNWNVDANWTNTSVFPNGGGSNAVINADITAPQTIDLNIPITIGTLSIGDVDGSAAYTIKDNGGSLSLFNGPAGAAITQLATSAGDTIAAPVTVITNLMVTNNSPNPLTFAGDFSGGGLSLYGGTLQIGDTTTNGSLTFNNITDQGAMVFDRSDTNSVGASISGAGSVTQNGSGVLILGGANSFTGPMTIAQGTLRVGSGSALGGSGGATVQNGATLDVNGTSLGAETITASGSGVNGEGAIYNSGAQVTSGIRYLTMTGDTWLGGTGAWNPTNNVGRWDVRGSSSSSVTGTLSTGGQPYNLIKVGGNQVSIVAISVDTSLANIDIQQGLMGWETVTTGMGNSASNLFVRAGATLSFYNAITAWNKNFVLYGNGTTVTVTNWSGTNMIIGPVQLNGGCVFAGGGTSLCLAGVVSGTGSLTKNGPYSLILSNATDTYTGNTVVNAGTLVLTNNASIAGTPDIAIAAGATLSASTLTLASGQTLQGNGTVAGNLTASTGSMVAPSGAPGTLTVTGTATLGGTTALQLSVFGATNGVLSAASIHYGGTLALTNSGGAYAAGDRFKIFNATSYSGAFTNIIPAIPDVNLAWNTSGLSSGVVSVVSSPTTSPRITISSGPNGLVFSGSNGVSGWPYYLLGSTNIATPLSNWTPLLSNQFDNNGNFIFTNNAGSNGQQFYILQLP